MIIEALKYSTKAENPLREYGIAVLLSLGFFLIFPLIILLGYFVKVIRDGTRGEEEIPRFDNFLKLFVDGLKLMGILIGYFSFLVISSLGFTSIGQNLGIQTLMAVISSILVLLVLYILPSAVANFARNDRAMASLKLREVFENAFTLRYLRGMISIPIAIIAITVAQIILFLLITITIIGIPLLLVIYPAAAFYEGLATYRIVGKMCE